MTDVTAERLVSYAAELRYEDLEPAVVHQVKRLVVDSFGCGLGAFTCEPAKALRGLAAEVSGSRTASVLGTRIRTTADMAAFVNGTMIRYLDFNDTYNGLDTAHPSDNIAAVLAAAEAYDATGKDLITGILLAYEVQSAWADTFSLMAGPFDQAAYATISTPLGVAKVMGLPPDQMREALRLSLVGGVVLGEARRGTLAHWKAAAVPNAGRNGVFAAQLAARGVTGPPAIFSGTHGFFAAVTGGDPPMALLAGESGHDRPFRIMQARIKRYPCGYFSQTAIEGALEARQALALADSTDIERVLIRTFDSGYQMMAGDPARWHPDSRETADHSIPYVVACALHFGSVELEHFDEVLLRDPRLVDLMQRIEVVKDPECQAAWPDAILNIVEVMTCDGKRHVTRCPYYRGHYRQPMSDSELEEKFRALTDGFLTRNQQSVAVQSIWRLEQYDDLTAFMRTFVV